MGDLQIKSRPKTRTTTKTKTKTRSRTNARNKAKHAHGTKSHAGLIVFAVILVLLVCAYGAGGFYFSQHFLPGTKINGTDVSLMTLSQAKEVLVGAADSYKLTLVEQDFRKEVITGEDIGLDVAVSDKFDSLLDVQSGLEWGLNILKNNSVTLDEDVITYDYDEEKLSGVVDELECIDPKFPMEAKDAEIVLLDGKFVISPENIGNTAHRDELEERIGQAIIAQQDKLDLEEEGLYDMPEVYADDPGLIAQKEQYDELNDLVITLKFGSKTVPINIQTISGWLKSSKKDDGTFKIDLKNDEVKKYVKNLAGTYDTYNKTKIFKSHAGNVVEIKTGDYGWMLDQDFAVDKLKELILKRESKTIDLTDGSEASNEWWYRKAVAYDDEGGTTYYGNTYAEVSVAEQHMWLYQNGVVTLETDVVTGNPNLGNDTPKGAFRIRYHQAPATLRGPGYVTQVAYWMVFADDVGFHDATWQPYFGGSLYLSNGSHGCVNMPLGKAGELYELVYDGMPVFVY